VSDSSRRDLPRILVVEDQLTNRLLLRAVFARATDPTLKAATLLEAETVAAARDILEREEVDLILLDVRLPDGSGLDLASELRDRGDKRPRIIILSASVLEIERTAALDAGGDAFMGKPFRPVELLDLIADLLAGRQPRQASTV
jgi:two-component system OmpR family response regulator